MKLKSFLGKVQNRIESRLDERGNILIWYVFMMPVLVGAAALAIDGMAVTATQTSIQSSLDAATQSTLAMSKNQTDGGKPSLGSKEEARNQFIKLYDANRSGIHGSSGRTGHIPFIKCQTSSTTNRSTDLIIPSASRCGFTLSNFNYSRTGNLGNGGYITATVQEKADTIFLQVLGFDDLTYTVSSTARLSNANY